MRSPKRDQPDAWAAVTAVPEEESLSYLLRGRKHQFISAWELERILAAWPDTPAVPFALNDLDIIAENLQVPFWRKPGYDAERRFEIAVELVAWIRQLRPWRFPPEEQDEPVVAAPAAAAEPAHEEPDAEEAARRELLRMAAPSYIIRSGNLSTHDRIICRNLVVAASIGDVRRAIALDLAGVYANVGDVTIYAPKSARIYRIRCVGQVNEERLSYVELLAMARKWRR